MQGANIGPIFLQTIPIPVQAQIFFDWMILLRIFILRDHLKGNFWDSQQPIIVYIMCLIGVFHVFHVNRIC